MIKNTQLVRKNPYLKWMADHTDTKWCNDSAIIDDLLAALDDGAIGCTTNPPLTYETLTKNPEIFRKAYELIPTQKTGDDRVVELLGVVVRHIAGILKDIYVKSDHRFGYVRTQVQPGISSDAKAMLEMGKILASWGENVKVKIPGTAAGIWVLEELSAMGIPNNPTVCVSVSQILAAAEANERGIQRAISKGIEPAASTSAIVMGRLQDYLTELNHARDAGLSTYDLECAALAVAKRCYQLFRERGYQQILMPAAFRSYRQVERMAGANVIMTIHPKIQDDLIRADAQGEASRGIMIDEPVDPEAISRVLQALPEFERAYEPNGLTPEEFDDFGATVMTLNGFDVTGWQKLREL
jgi:transaldolase